jgi:hypothetical protein
MCLYWTLFYTIGIQVLGPCWKEIVCIDVMFHEFEPYYTKPWDLDPFLEEVSLVTMSDSREGENGCVQNEVATQKEVIVGAIPCLMDMPTAQEVVDQDILWT